MGAGRTGWRLTQQGLEWAEKTDGSIEASDYSRTRAQSRAGGLDEQRYHRERSRITRTSAWNLWLSGERDIPQAEAKEVFRIDSYAKGSLLESKLTRVKAMFTGDEELTPFIDQLIRQLAEGTSP